MKQWLNLFRLSQSTTTPAASGPVVQYAIDDFFFVRGVLFLKGWTFSDTGEEVRVSVRLWDGSQIGLEKRPMSRPDLVDLFGSPAARAGFHAALVLPKEPSVEEIAKLRVVLTAGSTTTEVVDPVGAQHKVDAFYTSEKRYWDMLAAHPAPVVLEIGSRARSGISRKALFSNAAKYIGFDYAAGENVDVVGDAHELSRYIERSSVDFAFSVVVFEHLAMPWKVALEINKVLKVGGVAMINTVQSWPVHEEPWDYFRFSDYSWDSLFNSRTGFKIIDRGMGSRCVMAPAAYIPHLHECKLDWSYGMLATRCVAQKISDTDLEWPVALNEIVSTVYPH